jgi:formylglycine-generating enzyme required for sulfatase activity
MRPATQTLFQRLDDCAGQFPELREGVQKAIRVADVDPEMALTRSRKVLEMVVREVYERRCEEPPGTRPLENLLQRLVKDGHLPTRLDAHANAVRLLGNVGTHGFGQAVTKADVQQSLAGLEQVLDWYVTEGRPASAPARREPAPPPPAPPDPARIAVVPKGLRSFDAHDAGFFLELLPGPRDEHGLPESVRFWKHRAEAADEPSFTVGVLYGPSGCGKSSLVKAGLLPRLAKHVLPVYVEATAGDTEARLLAGLRKRCPGLPGHLDLTATLTGLRHGHGLSQGQKLFLVLDQFEQWLHAHRGETDTELARALRQCDGEHVQCAVLVRDDFWMELTRFMQEVQIDIVPGQNTAVVDLFDPRHARKVLSAFGHAFGTLAEASSPEQQAFLDQAVAGLAEDGRVISVRLAVFAEMVKGKPWTPATLKAVGGMAGVGVAFLEETFAAATAPPQHRLHQRAAQAVLKALLPETGTDIKGAMRSHQELLKASGYASRPREFEELLRILDSEVRLLTPTDPAGGDPASGGCEPPAGATRSGAPADGQGVDTPRSPDQYYQLTHDYLVPSLREWLTRKQKETRRGRAELRLAERAAAWTARPERRHLPAWWEWLNIRLFTRRPTWTPSQKRMMRKADRYHGLRGAALLLALAVAGWASFEVHGELRANFLVQTIEQAETTPDLLRLIDDDLPRYRRWADRRLRDMAEAAPDGSKVRLHAALALLPVDDGQADYLAGRLLSPTTEPKVVPVLRDALNGRPEVVQRLWKVLPDDGADPPQRLRAAGALATYDPGNPRWDAVRAEVMRFLVAEHLEALPYWAELLHPVWGRLLDPLVGRVPDVEPARYPPLLVLLRAYPEEVVAALRQELDRTKEPARKAQVAVALLQIGHGEPVWPLLKHSADPTLRTYLIHRLSPLGADPAALIGRLEEEPDASVRRALVLALGEFSTDELPEHQRRTLAEQLRRWYRDDPDAGLHGAIDWLLRRWGHGPELEAIDRKLVKAKSRPGPASAGRQPGDGVPGRWYVNGQGQTMVVVPGPVEFRMGDEGVPVRIPRSFAIAAKDVTVAQYRALCKDHDPNGKRSAGEPIVEICWYNAARYCRRLSEEEGVPEDQMCYPKVAEIEEGMKLPANYLHRTGYRLPTEAEWECACRAGTTTAYSFGDPPELLKHYDWFAENSGNRVHPVGGLKPNDLGLFDVHGNVAQWTQSPGDRNQKRPNKDVIEDLEDKQDIEDIKNSGRVLRGGVCNLGAVSARSSVRVDIEPAYRHFDIGFRPARTYR